MSLSGFLPVLSRRAIVISGVALASAISVPGLQAQQTTPPPQTTAPQTPAPADPLKFDTAVPRVVFISFTADAAQAFEQALGKAKDQIAKSDKPELKTQAQHWRVVKAAPQPDGTVAFIFIIDQTTPNASYNPFVILSNAGLDQQVYASEVTPLFTRVNAGIKGLSPMEGTFTDMGGAAAAAGS